MTSAVSFFDVRDSFQDVKTPKTSTSASTEYFCYNVFTFYSRYNMDWIANTEIGLDPNNSVIKRLRCTSFILQALPW